MFRKAPNQTLARRVAGPTQTSIAAAQDEERGHACSSSSASRWQ